MQKLYSIDKFKIHQTLANREFAFCRLDENYNVQPLRLNDIPYLFPVSKNMGSILVENLWFDGIEERFAEFVHLNDPINVLTVKTSNSTKIANINHDGVDIEFNVKDRFQTKIDEQITLLLKSAVGDFLVLPCIMFAFQIQKEGKVQYQLKFNKALISQSLSA